MTQLENYRRCTATNSCQTLCFGACPEETDAGILMKKWGYNASDPEDSLEFITNYGTDKLVNKTALNKTGNFCFMPSHCVNVTQEALETKKLFDKYW